MSGMNSAESSPFSEQDRSWIESSGRQLSEVCKQLQRFSSGFPPLRLNRAVTEGDGIFPKLSSKEAAWYSSIYEQESKKRTVCKFSPASGAASRMFRSLYAFMATPNQLSAKQQAEVEQVCLNVSDFAFFDALKDSLANAGKSVEELIELQEFGQIIEHLLSDEGLHFGQLPKALLPFHRYDGFTRTALEEHLVEAALYCQSNGEKVNVHFTVSAEHQAQFDQKIQALLPDFEAVFSCTVNISTSLQLPETDTLAADLSNQPFRDEADQLVFRPGGHGALLENLNRIQADWVFIKNIDNVVPDSQKAATIRWKKILGGILAYYQDQTFRWLRRLDLEEAFLEGEMIAFMAKELSIGFPSDFEAWETDVRLGYLYDKLNRPIRVCGVIRTDENTGGGPFWVEGKDRSQSIQLVETAQIDLEDPLQRAVASQSRFANITDLVCGIRDYQGQPFDLLQYRDEDTGFITQKSLNGRDLQALELPGLWNGAMADWTTILVEVPLSTFNPVKTVVDLLGRG